MLFRSVYRDGQTERLFHELSMGEKYRVGLDIAIKAAKRLAAAKAAPPGDDSVGGVADEYEPRGALLTLPQEAWESLDPINRASIAQQALEGDVWIVTAEATGDEELTAATYGPSNIELAS